MEKNAIKFVELYEESGLPKTQEEYFLWWNDKCQKFYKHRKEEYYKRKDGKYISIDDAFKIMCHINADLYNHFVNYNGFFDFGFYVAFKNGDYEMLNNALYQYARKMLIKDIAVNSSGFTVVLWDAAIAFACNDFEIIEHFFPKDTPLSDGSENHGNMVNLLIGLLYKDQNYLDTAVQNANKFLAKKQTEFEKCAVQYFLSLVNKNAEEASEALQGICAAYKKLKTTPAKKCFVPEIHGLYRIAKLIDKDLFNKIKRPKNANFFEEFELWQEKNNYPKGKLLYKYPQEMNYMNKILKAELPFVEFYSQEEYRRKNNEKHFSDLIENIQRLN